jgi:hypothetical protein
MASASKIRSLGKDKILDMFNNPPSLKENTPEVGLFIEMLLIYMRYCNDTFDNTIHKDRVNNPRKHAVEFVDRLLKGEFGV